MTTLRCLWRHRRFLAQTLHSYLVTTRWKHYLLGWHCYYAHHPLGPYCPQCVHLAEAYHRHP